MPCYFSDQADCFLTATCVVLVNESFNKVNDFFSLFFFPTKLTEPCFPPPHDCQESHLRKAISSVVFLARFFSTLRCSQGFISASHTRLNLCFQVNMIWTRNGTARIRPAVSDRGFLLDRSMRECVIVAGLPSAVVLAPAASSGHTAGSTVAENELVTSSFVDLPLEDVCSRLGKR